MIINYDQEEIELRKSIVSKTKDYEINITPLTTCSKHHNLQVKARDKKCLKCEAEIELTIDHIYPKSIFPELCKVYKNFQTLCSTCNSNKNNLNIEDYRKKKKLIEPNIVDFKHYIIKLYLAIGELKVLRELSDTVKSMSIELKTLTNIVDADTLTQEVIDEKIKKLTLELHPIKMKYDAASLKYARLIKRGTN